MIIETHDGWQSASIYGSAYIVSPDSALNQVTAQPMYIGYIVDSNDVWAEEGRNYVWTGGTTYYNEPKIILHTTNGGVIWQSFDAFDSARYRPTVLNFLVNAATHEVYCVLDYSTIDYAYSSDNGTTWRLDSTFSGFDIGGTWRDAPIGGVLWRLVNPAPGILWAMISDTGVGAFYGNIEIDPPGDVVPNSKEYCSKLAYSSDNGAHWLID